MKILLDKVNTIITQNNLLRTLLVETMERVKTLENKIPKSTAPVPEEKRSFFSKFSYLEFPVNSVERLKELEEILKEENNFQDAVNEFAKFGGSGTYDFMKRVLGFVLSNEVTIKYSWLGRKSKDAYSKLKLAAVVICAAEKAKVTESKKKCEGAIQSWLKRASDRMVAQKKINPGAAWEQGP